MNAFPDDYVRHNLPLVVLSGLGEIQDEGTSSTNARRLLSEGGFRIKIDYPPVNGDIAQTLLQALISHDSTNKPWHGRGISQPEQNAMFKIQAIGRTFTLPARKAPPPAHSPRLRPAYDSNSPPPQLVLHSPISPLTPSSPLYPDGITTPLWITKHQSRLPSTFITFFSLVSDTNTSTLQDNKVKSEIHNIRSVLTSTNYKTRLVVVLVGDGDVSGTDLEERLGNIRRATNLDNKTLLYLAAGSSENAISDFAQGLLSGLYAGCIEYYRDLSKHARRKRNRNVVPQPTIQPHSGTSQILSLPGWNVRYEFKLGVFAEFRQEMEAALRNYETAYDNLFSSEVFETIPSWSSRFNEARLTSDVISIRIIRCLLWLGQTTNSVKWWISHRNRIQSLVDRRGAGTETYGWEAWQSIWSRTMAQLIERAEVLVPLAPGSSESFLPKLFIDSEKTLSSGQRYSPWESLHHEGYWLNIAQRHIQNRRARALQMPEEDRASPGQSPASAIASKAHLYDKYLALEPYKEYPIDSKPGFDYSGEIIKILDAAVEHFSERKQVRMAEFLQLQKALELMKAELWADAISGLVVVWESQAWRKSGWWILLEHVGLGLLACASQIGRKDVILKTQWQLAHSVLNQTPHPDIQALENMDSSSATISAQVALETEHSLSPYIPSFAFATEEGHVGEFMDAQFSIQRMDSSSMADSQLSQLKVVFEGGLKPVHLVHETDTVSQGGSEKTLIVEVDLEDAQSKDTSSRRSSMGVAAAMIGEVSLALNPGQTKVFQMKLLPREAGDVSVASVTMIFESGEREMTVTTSDIHEAPSHWWEFRHDKPIARPCGRYRHAADAKVLPKPPKIEITVSEMRKVFYANEAVNLTIESENNEDGPILGQIEARLVSPVKNSAIIRWNNNDILATASVSDTGTSVQQLPAQPLGKVAIGGRVSHSLSIDNTDEAIDHELEIVINYAEESSPDTKLTRVLILDVPVIRPFEANFSFHSRVHDETWPNFFSTKTISHDVNQATGIKQEYLITAVVCSFALEDILVRSVKLTTQKIVGGASCAISQGTLRQPPKVTKGSNDEQILVHPEETKKFGFDMTLQKVVLGDRQPVAIDVLLEIQWRLKSSEQLNTSILQVPRFLAPSAEPRVLMQGIKEPNVSSLYRLTYTIENPSLHFLTFNLTMESSEDFAFSGTKSKSLSLVPVSRHTIVYRILSQKAKAWVRVHLEVVDAYFGQTLKIQPASDGIRIDKQGNVLIWIE